jgi:phosphohistidine phosphatase
MSSMRVVLFRHGPAGERDPARWPNDDLRPLSPRGEARTRAAAAGLVRLVGEVREIWSSPLARCQATAALLREACPAAKRVTVEALRPGGSWREVIDKLREGKHAGTIVLVGHEPDLGKLAGMLVFGAPRALPLKKAGACAADFGREVDAGKGELAWLLTPRVLRSLRNKKQKEKAR